MTRDDLTRLLAEAVRRRAITLAESAEILRAYDAGTLDPATLPREIRDGLDGSGSLAATAVLSAALILLARSRTGRVWTYDAATRRYTAPRPVAPPKGVVRPPTVRTRTLAPEQVRRIVDEVIDKLEPEMVAQAEAITVGRVTLAEWVARMEDMIAERHVLAAAAARGGFSQMSEADREWVRARIEDQFERLDGFAADLASDRQRLDGRLSARVRLYAQAARGTYEAMRGRVAAAAGFDEERNVLGGADHCAGANGVAGCLDETRRGWVPIGDLAPVGSRVCSQNCRCILRYRRGGVAEAVA